MMSEDQELALGRRAHQQILRQYEIYSDNALQQYVQGVGKALAANSHRPGLVYRFTVLDSKEVNAFALPGGYVYITRGLLAYLESEAELAAILSHEIGHVTARHSVRQYSAAQAASLGAIAGAIFFPEMATLGVGDLVNVLGTALLRGYGREHELEADRLGAEYIARLGYPPGAMIDVIRGLKSQEIFETRIAREEGREPQVYHGLFSTHPDHDTRLREVITQAGHYQNSPRPAGLSREEFLRKLDGLVFEDSPREGIVRGGDFFHLELGVALRFPAAWRVKNLPDRILAVAPGQAAMLRVTVQDLNKRIPPRSFMIEQLGLRNLAAEGQISPSGLEGHSAVALVETEFGRREARISVIYFDDRAYIVAGSIRDAADIARYDTAFLETAKSFHPLSAEERRQVRPLRLALMEATGQTSFAALARDSPLGAHAEQRLRLINGLYPEGEAKPGSWLKIVK